MNSIVSIEIGDETPVYFSEYQKLAAEVQTAFGTISDLTKLLDKKKLALENSKASENPYKKMVQTALLMGEIYLLYVLPIGLVSKGFESWVSEVFADSIEGLFGSTVLGVGIGRCLQIFLRMFYDPKPPYSLQIDSYKYQAIRQEAFALLRVTEAKVDMFAKKFDNYEMTPALASLKEQINQAEFDLFQQFPHSALILEAQTI